MPERHAYTVHCSRCLTPLTVTVDTDGFGGTVDLVPPCPTCLTELTTRIRILDPDGNERAPAPHCQRCRRPYRIPGPVDGLCKSCGALAMGRKDSRGEESVDIREYRERLEQREREAEPADDHEAAPDRSHWIHQETPEERVRRHARICRWCNNPIDGDSALARYCTDCRDRGKPPEGKG